MNSPGGPPLESGSPHAPQLFSYRKWTRRLRRLQWGVTSSCRHRGFEIQCHKAAKEQGRREGGGVGSGNASGEE